MMLREDVLKCFKNLEVPPPPGDFFSHGLEGFIQRQSTLIGSGGGQFKRQHRFGENCGLVAAL